MRALLTSLLCAGLAAQAPGTLPANVSKTNESSFRKITEWPTPNEYRAASGAPGHAYWQQKVDYHIQVALDDATQSLKGHEDISYHNNSPDELRYLWLQLDQNLFKQDSGGRLSHSAPDLAMAAGDAKPGISMYTMNALAPKDRADGHHIESVKGEDGRELPYTIVDTMMRVDLPEPLKPGATLQFSVAWHYTMNDYKYQGGRCGFERFDDGQILYNVAQWQPRLVAYTDDMGWQHQQYLGQGEFTLEFGDWDVEITVPWDHIVLATGELQNADQVLTQAERDRLEKAKSSDKPVFIVAPDEAGKPVSRPTSSGTSTWRFKASQVRDFAFNTSRRQIWDAMGVKINDRTVMAMSGYTKEGMPLWDKYSTRAVAHTLKTYGRYTFDFPYPVAQSCMGLGGGGGMEYPMLCFNGPRPEKDGTYSQRTKLGVVGVIIHEVGHNFFPMIVNSDERQWTWMDEGLNTFLQTLAEWEWDPQAFDSGSPVQKITEYLKYPDASPIMTQSDAARHLGFNAYRKPAAGLLMLRETILGRQLFDYAFRTYAQRWKFKRPQPADFFRTMNDASGMDLDWFWRGWFYTTKAPDLAIEKVEAFRMADMDPAKVKAREKADFDAQDNIIRQRNKENIPAGGEEKRSGAQDFYSDGSYDPYKASPQEQEDYAKQVAALKPEEKEAAAFGKTIYRVTVKNVGGFVMPIILKLSYRDGSSEVLRLPVESWLQNEERYSKLVVTDKELASVELDPFKEIPDVDRSNDAFPPRIAAPEPLHLAKPRPEPKNPMQERKGAKKPEGK